MRVLRRLLVRYRGAGKIDKHLYHELYHLSKGNAFKHKRALIEHVRQFISAIFFFFFLIADFCLFLLKQIQRAKAERQRERHLKEEMDAKRAKNKAGRERRQDRLEAKRNAQLAEPTQGQ